MVSVEKALEAIEEATPTLAVEQVSVSQALFGVAAESVESPIDLPPFAQSAMDGYVVRAADTVDASEEEPVVLEIVGEVAAGAADAPGSLGPGQAVRIATGGQVPEGGDTIVRQERARREGERLVLTRAFAEGSDLRPVGEELERGTPLVDAGERLDERQLAALSMTGHSEVAVHRRPRIGILVSGDEVVSPDADLDSGEIYDANTPLLRGFVERLGYDAVEIHRIADESASVERALDRALTACDIVVSTGGVSVGDYDFLGDAAGELGAEEIFWGVDQKPGRPVYFGCRDETPFLGLPGNPGAVFVDAHLYLTRILDALEGGSDLRPRFRPGRLTGPIERSSSRLRWAPCRRRLSEEGTVELAPIRRGRAHRLGELFRADALVPAKPGNGVVEAGSLVRWVETGHDGL